jgi:NADH-quinone oxidoreductase subunit N
MMVLVMANDLLVLFLALETFSISLYVLAGYVRNERLSQEAALKYFVTGSFAAGCFLYGAALTYAVTGSTNLEQTGAVIAAGVHSLPALAHVALALLMVGLCFKIALAPFHQWTPDVYEGAPLAVTAFMATATKAAAFAALLRVLWTGFGPLAGSWLPLLAALAVLTMLVGNLAALVQSDMKRMLAFSAIAHAGYLLVAVLAGPTSGTAAMLYYLCAYALMTIGAFVVLMAIDTAAPGDRDATDLGALAGLSRRQPWLALALAACLFALTGFPPTMGFLAKWYVFQTAIEAGLAWLAVAVVVNSVVSAFYYLRPVVVMYLAAPVADEPIPVATPTALVVGLTALLVALGVVLSGPLVEHAQTAGLSGPQRAPAGPQNTASSLEPAAPLPPSGPGADP